MSAIASKLLLFWLACPVLVVVFAWDFVRWRRLLRHGRRVRGTTKTPRVVVERRQPADRRRHCIRYDYRVGETYYEGEVGSFEYSADKAAAGREVVVLYMPGAPGQEPAARRRAGLLQRDRAAGRHRRHVAAPGRLDGRVGVLALPVRLGLLTARRRAQASRRGYVNPRKCAALTAKCTRMAPSMERVRA